MKNIFFNSSLRLLFLHRNNIQGFTLIGFLVRIFLYSGVLITLLLPFLNEFETSSFSDRQEAEGKNSIGTINRSQQAYLLEMGRFADSLRELPIQFMRPSYYTLQIISPMIPVADINNNSNYFKSFQNVITIAQPLPQYSNYIKSYIGAVFYETNTGNYITGICQMNAVKTLPTSVPTLNRDRTIQCPPGSTLLSSSTNSLR